jgi:fermentation-respiration switch protein FrsA (DUF1100 family)
MWRTLHYIIVVVYILAPVAAAGVDLAGARRRKRGSPSAGFFLTCAAGILLGSMMTLIYGVATGGWPKFTQVAMACYFAASLLVILKSIDALMRMGVEWVSHKLRGRGKAVRWPAVFSASMLRVLALFGIGLPYVMAAVLTYRPKVVASDDPRKQLGFQFETVSFETSDSLRISGWWIPAKQKFMRQVDSPDFGTKTVIVCHGLASSKANHLIMSRSLVPAGYNVLIFDFRAHGESDGQFASFGDLERRDVLAAVRFVKTHKPRESQHVYGVGASMGAAALISAAGDPAEEGQAIEAVAVYGTYDDLRLTERAVSMQSFPVPLRQIVDWFAIPMASAQVGSDLQKFRPADSISAIWPRPVLIIHGINDQIIPFERGRALFDAAYEPRERIWLEKSDHNSIIADEKTAERVREFFDRAEPVPVVLFPSRSVRLGQSEG